MCLNLPCNKAGGIDNTAYEHLKFGGKQLWQVLSDLFVSMYSTHNVPSCLKIQLLLPIFKGRKLKASNKANYRGITLFSVFCKVFELLLLDHSESIAQKQNYFSDLQFGFSNGVECIEASYVISESVNQAVEQGDKVFACFLDVRKAFDTVWHNGLLFKLYEELSTDSGLWLIIRDLYQDLHAHVIHGGQLSSKFPISQGSGQGRILAPFVYKVYIYSLIRKICDLKVGICLTNRVCSAPTFADDMTLLGLHASALSTLIRCAYDYCCKWRYEYHNEKSGTVVFGETPAMQGRIINTRKFFIGSSLIEEVKEYINLGIYKN